MSPRHINGKILGDKVHFFVAAVARKKRRGFIISAELRKRDDPKTSKVF